MNARTVVRALLFGTLSSLTVVSAVVAQPAPEHDHGHDHAQDHVHAAAADDNAGAPVADDAQTVHLTVRLQIAPDADRSAIAQQDISVHVVRPPHELLQTITGHTDDNGVALVEVPFRTGVEVYAEVNSQRRIFSDPVPLVAGQPAEATIVLRTITHDPSVVEAARLITVMEPWEDFVIVQQVWTFDVPNDVIWRANLEDAGPGMAGRMVRVPLPAEAKGIRVVQPVEQTRVIGSTVFYGAEIAPLVPGSSMPPHMIVQYSMPLSGGHEMLFEQGLMMNVRDATIAIPMRSQLRRHPLLSVRAEAPLCAEGAASGQVCFAELSDDTDGLPAVLGQDVMVFRGAQARSGDMMTIRTWGWPYRVPWEKWAAGTGAASVLLGGLWFLFHESRRRPLRRNERSNVEVALLLEQQALLDAIVDMDLRWERGEMTTREYEAGHQQIVERLGIVQKRLRETGGSAGPGAVAS